MQGHSGRWAITIAMPPRSRTPGWPGVSAAPSLSRLEFGSSSTIRNGLPERAGEADALALPAGESGTALPDLRVSSGGRRRIISWTSAAIAARTTSSALTAWKRAMFWATVPANSSTSCGR